MSTYGTATCGKCRRDGLDPNCPECGYSAPRGDWDALTAENAALRARVAELEAEVERRNRTDEIRRLVLAQRKLNAVESYVLGELGAARTDGGET